MKRLAYTAAALGAAGAVLLVAALAALRTESGARAAIALVESVAGYDVNVAALRVSGWTWAATDLRVAARRGGPEFFQASWLTIDLGPAALLRGRVHAVALEGFELDLARMPSRQGAAAALPFEELRATGGVLRGVSNVLQEIRAPDIVFARAEGYDGLEIRGRLESGDALEIEWSGRAATDGDELSVRARGTLRDLSRVLQAGAVLGADPGSALDFEADISGSLRGDLHVSAAAKTELAVLRVPVRATLVADRVRADGELSYRADVIAEGVSEPLKLSGVVRERDAAAPIELKASWRELRLAEVSALLRERARFDASAGALSLDATVEGAFDAPVVRVAAEVTDVAAKVGSVGVNGTCTLSVTYADGVLTSDEHGLDARSFEISTPAMKASVKQLRAEPSLDAKSGVRSLRLEHLAVEGGVFSNGTGDVQASGIELSGRLEATFDPERLLGAELQVSVPRGELLYKRAYLDVSAFPADASLHVTSDDTTWTGEGTLKLAKLATVRADGERGRFSGTTRLHVQAESRHLRAAFEKLVRDTFADAYPMLARTDLAGGASFDVTIGTSQIGSTATGRLRVRDLTLRVEDPPLRAAGVTLDLPIALTTRPNEQLEPSAGRLRIAEAGFGETAIGLIDLPLTVRTNEIAAGTPLRIEVAGGAVSIDGLRALALASEAPALEARVDLSGLDLAVLSVAAGSARVEGRLDGTLGLVRVAESGATTEAALDVAAFGGNAHVSDVSIRDLFSPVPALHLDVFLSRIDLRKATEAIGVGHVSGVLEGEIGDLEIAAGQPVQFEARLETVPVSDVPQRISVTAIDQLAVLSGGASGGSLARGVMGLFSEYRYAKLGVRCSLRNDRFLLQGVATHEDKDFLVVGTLIPPTVNVVSHNRVIAFKEMVKRLERIKVTGASEPAPVREPEAEPGTAPQVPAGPPVENETSGEQP